MLNSDPINSWSLNALAGGGEPVEPVVIEPPLPPNPPLPPYPPNPDPDPSDPDAPPAGVYPGFPVPPPPAGHSFRWSAVVTLGGVDITELLTGSIRVDREEGASGIAEFGLFYMPGQFVQTDLADRTVTIDYITDDGVDAVQVRLFTGLVAEPRWDAPARTMFITATDNLQNNVEAMTIEQVDSITQGNWSDDVFAPLEGRSRWDYALERMSTRAAALNCDPLGNIITSSWYSKSTPDYIFNYDTTIYQSINVSLAQLRNVTNRVEIEVNYRYPRLQDARETFSWTHPGTGGSAGITGFCAWRTLSSELPDREMVLSAVSGAGLTPVSASWYDLPGTAPNPCGNGQPWINNQVGLLLGAGAVGARRWSQSVTETYKLNLATVSGQVDGQQVISRISTSVDVKHDDEDGWETSLNAVTPTQAGSTPIGPINPQYGPPGDRVDETRRTTAIGVILSMAHTDIIGAHRATTVSWQVPTSMALGIDLSHTVEIQDQYTQARAKVSHRIDDIDLQSGSAITTIMISVMRGGGVNDPLLVPERLGGGDMSGGGSGWDQQVQMATQLGGRFTSGSYDDALDGFSGNYSVSQDNTLETFPRRFSVTAPEIAATRFDEKKHELTRLYRVAVPNDLLEL